MEESVQSLVRHGRDMTSGSIPRHLIHFSLPMLAGNIVQTAYSIVNAIWVGKGLGKADLAAVTVSFPIVFLLMSIAIGLTTGTSILVAQFAGAKNWVNLRKAVQTSTCLLISCSVFLFILGELATPWLMRMMETPPNVYMLAVSYMRVFLCSIPFIFATFLIVSMLRGIGDSKTPLYFQVGSLILTAVLDPILMFGWLGFPRFGLNGTAIASVTMQGVAMAAMFVYLYRKDHIVAPDWLRLSVDWPTLGMIVKIGLPSVIQQSLVSLGMVVVIGLVNTYGENATAAYGAGMRIDQIAFLPAMTFNAAASTVVGQNIGAGQIHRVKDVFKWALIICCGITFLGSFVSLLEPRLLLKMFLKDSIVISIGIGYLRIAAINYLLFSVLFISNGIINGSGHTLITTCITAISFWLARVPLAVYLSHRMHRVEAIWYAILISSAFSVVISLSVYASGWWKKPVVRNEILAAACPAESE